MKVRDVFLLLLQLAPCTLCAQQLCDANDRTKVEDATLLPNGSLQSQFHDFLLPDGTFWKEEETLFYWCPCRLGNYFKFCQRGTFLVEEYLLERGNSSSCIRVLEEDEERLFMIEEQFQVYSEAKCPRPLPINYPTDDLKSFVHLFFSTNMSEIMGQHNEKLKLLSNGSLLLAPSNTSKTSRLLSPTQFCIIPLGYQQFLDAVCNAAIEALKPNAKEEVSKFKLNLYYMIGIGSVSCFFLLLNVIAYLLSADLKNLHGLSLASFSACLLLVYLSYLLSDVMIIATTPLPDIVCIIFAYLYYFGTVASLFWLNVICLDIYLTFKGSFAPKRETNLMLSSLIAWGGPTLMMIIVLVLNPSTHTYIDLDDVSMCWILEFWTEWPYLYVPMMASLGLNLVLFWLTAWHLWIQRKESRMAFRGANSSRMNSQDRDQFKMYMKLFLLMAITSVNMFTHGVLFAVGTKQIIINFIVASMNYLRGPLIFWFCIWSRKSVREAFMCCKKPKVQLTPSITITSNTTFNSNNSYRDYPQVKNF